MRYFTIIAFFLLSVSTFAQESREELTVGLSGNAYVTSARRGARIAEGGLQDWTDPESVVSVYFYLDQPEQADLALVARGDSEIKVSYEDRSFDVKLQSADFVRVPVGTINVSEPGYVRIDLQGVSKSGESFGQVRELIVDGVKGRSNYVKDFSDYWGRRGPSVHLGYDLPEGDIEWFYNEVTVPDEGETIGSYYMAAGFGEGYFGMQYNSPRERRVLFSVWSPFDTQDPREIPDDQKIKLLQRGEGVHIGEFGNEGSGGQSYLRYPWKAGETYKFLMRVHPDGAGNTIYTAYFAPVDSEDWQLIASFLRPQTSTWYTHAHSFLENFIPEQGFLTRKVLFGNQWAGSKDGRWTPVTNATFTHDATATAGVRRDYRGGTLGDKFFLQMGGFFTPSTPMGTPLSR